jgi:Domain of unknown function (DUF4402)
MKKKYMSLGIALVCVAFVNTIAFAQASATANASATIVTPISISKNNDMNFGNVATDGTVGTVILAPASTRTLTGGVTLPATTGTVAAASFAVTGSGSYTYSISLPSSVIIASGANQMTVNTFTSTPSLTGTLSSGAQTLLIGATLNLTAPQAAGSYTSASPFTVTVNYN